MSTTAVAGPAVEAAGLVKRYGAHEALSGLNLRVDQAAVTAVLGPNGAGKTTTIEICEGLRKPDGGWVRVLGLDPATDGTRLRARVGVMLQGGGGVYPGVRAGEMLSHMARLYRHPLELKPLLERLGLSSVRRRPYRRLSGGERQRLALAIAVVGRPELVFLDEPTAGLDPQSRHAAWDLVRDLRDDGVTVVLTTHLMDEAERLADSVVVMDAGLVLTEGSPAALTSSGPAAAVHFTAPPGLDLASLLDALPHDTTATETAPGRYRISGDVDPQLLATLTAWCAGHGVMPEHLDIGRRSLEDVFLELTGRGLRT